MDVSIELTDEQLKSLDMASRGPAKAVDPRSHSTYVLVPEQQYLELIEDDRQQIAIHRIGLRNAARRMDSAP